MAKPRYRVAATSAGEVLSLTKLPEARADGSDTIQDLGGITGTRLRPAYEGASMRAPRMSRWLPSSPGPNATLAYSLPTLRARSRDRRRNDGLANQVIDELTVQLIGTGVKPRFKTPDAVFNKLMNQLFNDWTPEADADDRVDFYGAQALAVSSMLEGGDMFTRVRPRKIEDELTVPMQLQLLEGEFCPVEMNRDLGGAGYIQSGIEFGPIGNRTAYYLYKVHPNDVFSRSLAAFGLPIRVSAEQVIHLADIMPRRIGRIRGEPWFVRLLIKLHDLDQYDDAQLMRQKVASLFAGFTESMQADPFAYDDDEGDEGELGVDPVNGERIRVGDSASPSLEPGMIQDLDDGEKITFSTPPGPGESYDTYVAHQERRVAAGGSVSYEALTGDYRYINDRTYRASMNVLRRRYGLMQFQFVKQWCRPVMKSWLNLGVASGVVTLPQGQTVMDVLKRVQWSPQRWEYINPLQDIAALRSERRAGYASRDMQCAERGDDTEEIDDQVEAEDKRVDKKGIVYDTDPRYVNDKGIAQKQSTEVVTAEGKTAPATKPAQGSGSNGA